MPVEIQVEAAAGTTSEAVAGALNLYATLDDLKARLGITGVGDDAQLVRAIESASREVDAYCGRHFYAKEETRYFDVVAPDGELLLDDVLSVSAFTVDSEADGTYDGETWTQNDDFFLRPDQGWPKWAVWVPSWGDYAFAARKRYVKVVGVWGYGTGRSATPYRSSGITVTVADATTETVTVSAEGTIEVGHTIRAGTEQMYVRAATSGGTNQITVTRGVNGTTAAAHSAAAASIYEYPRQVVEGVLWLAGEVYAGAGHEGLESERIGNYSYKRLQPTTFERVMMRLFGPFKRR